MARYPTTPETVRLGDVQKAERGPKRAGCNTAKSAYAWLRYDVCATPRGRATTEAPTIDQSAAAAVFAAAALPEIRNREREMFVAIALDSKNRPVGIHIASIGGRTATVADPKTILSAMLLVPATSFLLLHNHPSGNPQPSPEDSSITKRLFTGGVFIGLTLVDHIVLGWDGNLWRWASLSPEDGRERDSGTFEPSAIDALVISTRALDGLGDDGRGDPMRSSSGEAEAVDVTNSFPSQAPALGAALGVHGRSYNYGQLPDYATFEAAFDKALAEDGSTRYRVRLGRSDSAAAEDTTFGDGEYTASQLYRAVKELIVLWEKGNEPAGELASTILATLKIDWT